MADIEKVIKGLSCLARVEEPMANPCAKCGYKNSVNFAFCVVDITKDAIELLKEQQPKKPVYDCPLIRCPRCKNSINVIQKYCDECGQAIDWSKDGEQE